MVNQPLIYVVDPDPGLATALGALLQTYGISVRGFDTVPGFLAAIRSGELDESILLLGLDFSGVKPEVLLDEVCTDQHCVPTIAVSCQTDSALRQMALNAGALDLVHKSLLAAYLFNRLQKHCPAATGMPHTDVATQSLRNGIQVTFRMMQPEDADLEQAFVTSLSDRSRYLRFFSGLRKLPPYMLLQLTHPEFPLSYAVIATTDVAGREQQIGVARYAPTEDETVAEFAVVVSDEWQGHGIGSELLQLVITAAAVGGLHRLEGLILRENSAMRALAKKLGFVEVPDGSVEASAILVAKDLRKH
jgi:RimJ/RimL family protein N-acetyltransferase